MTQQKLKIARVDNLAARFPLFLMAYRHLCSEFHLHHPGSHYPCPLSWPQRRHLTLFLSFGSQSRPHSHPMSDDFLFRLFSSSVTAGTSVTSGVDILQSKVQGIVTGFGVDASSLDPGTPSRFEGRGRRGSVSHSRLDRVPV